nr:MAG TPA: hypothetical protein [Caudoviricetes sp.]
MVGVINLLYSMTKIHMRLRKFPMIKLIRQ